MILMPGTEPLFLFLVLRGLALSAEGAILFGLANGVVAYGVCLLVCVGVSCLGVVYARCTTCLSVLGDLVLAALWLAVAARHSPLLWPVCLFRVVISMAVSPLAIVFLAGSLALACARLKRARRAAKAMGRQLLVWSGEGLLR